MEARVQGRRGPASVRRCRTSGIQLAVSGAGKELALREDRTAEAKGQCQSRKPKAGSRKPEAGSPKPEAEAGSRSPRRLVASPNTDSIRKRGGQREQESDVIILFRSYQQESSCGRVAQLAEQLTLNQ